MQLLVAYESDPAGFNMASQIIRGMGERRDGLYRGRKFDLLVIPTPAISADWLEEKYHYDGYVFLSKHASESGTLALTCHSTGNFGDAKFGACPPGGSPPPVPPKVIHEEPLGKEGRL